MGKILSVKCVAGDGRFPQGVGRFGGRYGGSPTEEVAHHVTCMFATVIMLTKVAGCAGRAFVIAFNDELEVKGLFCEDEK